MDAAEDKRPSPKRFIYAAIVLSVFILIAVPLLIRKKDRESVTYTRNLMGTLVEITVYDVADKKADPAVEAAYAEIKRLEGVFSSYMPESDVVRISKAAGIGPVRVSPETIKVLEEAVRVSELSGGAFDPTVGVLGGLWGFSGESGKVPDKKEVARLLRLVDYKKIIIDRAGSRAGLKDKGMALNLGGIAKGYIVAEAVKTLRNNGIARGIVKAGGDMTVFQAQGKTGQQFVIGVQDPRAKRLMGEVHIFKGAVATSGDYERFFVKDNVRYHHILDPRTGFPADRAMSATVISDNPAEADALSTAVFVMGPKDGLALLERLGVQGVIVGPDNKAKVTKHFDGWIATEK